eukprot:3906888-Pyramimonas_sp.AAC.1
MCPGGMDQRRDPFPWESADCRRRARRHWPHFGEGTFPRRVDLTTARPIHGLQLQGCAPPILGAGSLRHE